MIRRAFAWLVSPLWRMFIRVIPEGDPWERIAVAPDLRMYGSGARFDFPKYLAGPSNVSVTSIGEIQDWLLGCKYESDEVLFAESDFWQHPATFERLRAGDCEDFALWAWRKLIELGVDAEIITGYRPEGSELGGRHAWIVFRQEGAEYLFEPTCPTKEEMIRPLADVRNGYLPELGADRAGHRFGFTGYATSQKRLLQAESKRKRPG